MANGNQTGVVRTLDIKTLEIWRWDAACSIRGALDAPKYKDYILPLIFVKRLSDVFDDEIARLTAEFGDEARVRSLVKKDHGLVRFYIPPKGRNGSIPLVKTGEINYPTIIDTEEKITPAGMANSSARLMPARTLLMARYGQGVARGRVAILGIEATTNQACAAVFPNEILTTGFLYVYLTFAYERVRIMGHGAQQRNLSGETIKTIKIPVPPLDEQREITRILRTVDGKIAAAERKRAMLGQLMTGKVRAGHLIDTIHD